VTFDPDCGAEGEPLAAAAGAELVPAVAVVVPTHQRRQCLERLVTSLEKQSLPAGSFEVVVVDDASTDGTSEELETLARSSGLRLRALRTQRRSGPAAARNMGWRSTRAPVVAFTDDDCAPDPQWLEAGLTALGDRARVVVGKTGPPADQGQTAGSPFARVMAVGDTRFFETCNVFYRRCDLEAVGGFDERFRRPSGEDTHLGLRVVELGVQPVFAPDAIVHHDVRPGSALAAWREATRWTDGPLVLKGRAYARRGRVHRYLFWKASHPPAILACVGLVAGLRIRPALLLVVPWIVYRMARNPVCTSRRRRLTSLPAALVIDLTEVAVMVRGSIRHHTIVL
jgi:glycosyltransferase involved in cell wall biosynthesis